MGYTIRIGQAVVRPNEDGGALFVTVDEFEHPEAPAYDGCNPRKNQCFPSYGNWTRSAREVGLHEFFYGAHELPADQQECKTTDVAGFLRPHAGARQITIEHLATVREARIARQRRHPEAIPGWDPAYDSFGKVKPGATEDPRYDPDLARLLWLEWWMQWAIQNCELLAMYNT